MRSAVVATTFAATLAALADASLAKKQTTAPTVASAEVVGTLVDPLLNRDSCTSVRVGARQFWTCRDSSSYPWNPNGFFYGSSASWTDFLWDGSGPNIQNGNLTCASLNQGAYFKPPGDVMCGGDAGGCDDNTRWLLWPDTPPLPISGQPEGTAKLYTWLRNNLALNDVNNMLHLNGDPPGSLWRTDFDSTTQPTDSLPPVTMVAEKFWPADVPTYGNYGWVNVFDVAYLYGTLNLTESGGSNVGGVALARVSHSTIEDPSTYEFYYPANQTWIPNLPHSSKDPSASIPNAGTGNQGTFYYSDYIDGGKFVWIGSPSGFPNSQFAISTASAPEGPWTEAEVFYEAPAGTQFAGYSQQAHPGLSTTLGTGDDVYLSFTKIDDDGFYQTPLVHVVWG